MNPAASPATKPLCHAVVMRATDRHGQGKGRATKLLTCGADGFEVQGEPHVSWWHWERVPLGGIDDIADMLQRLAGDSSAIVVGDDIRQGATAVVNKVVVEPEAPGDKVPDLRRRDRRWVALDCDGWTPPGWPLPATPTEADIDAAVRALVDTLGPAFQGAECVYRLSASAGLVAGVADGVRVPGWQRLRCHVWLWLDRPVAPASVKAWCSALFPLRKNAKGRMEPVDPLAPHWDHGMLDGARIHYVADPVVKGAEIADIVPVSRIGRLSGRAVVAPATWRTMADMAADEARANAEGAAYLAATRPASRLAEMCWRSALKVIETKLTWTSKGSRAGSSASVFGVCRMAFSSAAAAEQKGRAGSVDEVEGILLARGVKRRTASAARTEGLKPGHVARTVETAQAEMGEGDDARAPTTRPATKPFPAVEAVAANDDADEVPWFFELEEVDDIREEIDEVGPFCVWPPGVVAVVQAMGATSPATKPDRLTTTQAWAMVLDALDTDPDAWPADAVAACGGMEGARSASWAGAGVVGVRCREQLREWQRSTPKTLTETGLVARRKAWPPVAVNAPVAFILPVFGAAGGSLVGLYACDLQGAFLGRLGAALPVGLRWLESWTSDTPTRPERAVVVVANALDAVAYADALDALDIDVVAVGDTDPATWASVTEGREAVVVARAGAWAGAPTLPAGRVKTASPTWRHRDEAGRRAAVELWVLKLLEVNRYE